MGHGQVHQYEQEIPQTPTGKHPVRSAHTPTRPQAHTALRPKRTAGIIAGTGAASTGSWVIEYQLRLCSESAVLFQMCDLCVSFSAVVQSMKHIVFE